MALTNCKECGSVLSTSADVCPNCGKKREKFGFISLIMMIIIISIVYSYISDGLKKEKSDTQVVTTPVTTPPPTSNWKNENNSTMAFIIMKDFVKKDVNSKSMYFPMMTDATIRILDNQKYMIRSWVEYENKSGDLKKAQYVGVVMQTDKESWKLISLNIL